MATIGYAHNSQYFAEWQRRHADQIGRLADTQLGDVLRRRSPGFTPEKAVEVRLRQADAVG